MKVRATDEYQKNNLKSAELGKIPQAGEEFEIASEKFEKLNGNNKYNAVFVEEVKNDILNSIEEVSKELVSTISAENMKKEISSEEVDKILNPKKINRRNK